jgi:hypothetical protein
VPAAELDELYASAPADFIATRDRLVRRLREAGDKEAARELARRRRPTRGAHAVNELARGEQEALAGYVELGERIRAAQVAAARDEAARDELRALDRDRRARLTRLLDRVDHDRDDAERALAVALVDPELAEIVKAGHLERVPESPGGFATFGDELAAAAPPTPRRRDAGEERRRDRLRGLEEEMHEARAALTARQTDVRRAREGLAQSERQLRDAQRRVERLEAERERLRG